MENQKKAMVFYKLCCDRLCSTVLSRAFKLLMLHSECKKFLLSGRFQNLLEGRKMEDPAAIKQEIFWMKRISPVNAKTNCLLAGIFWINDQRACTAVRFCASILVICKYPTKKKMMIVNTKLTSPSPNPTPPRLCGLESQSENEAPTGRVIT